MTVKLSDKFRRDEIEWRIQRSGIKNGKAWAMVLPYLTSRAIMDRLDNAVGPMNWKVTHKQFSNGIACTISLRVGTDKDDWVSKEDGASETAIENFKGGMSDSFKRAAVMWGMGRYLYAMKGPFFSTMYLDKDHEYQGVIKEDGKTTYYTWDAPDVPEIYAD